MNTEPTIEDCFSLSPAEINRNLYRIRKIGTSIDPKRPDIDYWLDEDTDGNFCVFFTVSGSESQRILLEGLDLPFGGYRQYFRCECGARISKVYLPPGSKEFKCRHCYKLRYLLTTFDPKSPHGTPRYQLNRLDRLSTIRAGMGTVLYKGKYTKKFERFLRMCGRVGFTDIVSNARKLIEDIKVFQQPH